MDPALAQLIPLAVIGLPIALLFGLLILWDWQAIHSRKKNPLTSDLLRGPGEALREKIEELRIDQLADMFLAFLLPLLIYAMGLTSYSFAYKLSANMIVFYASLTILLLGYVFFRISKRKTTLRLYQLGLDAEMSVGQELNHLMREGFWVYHDFPADDFNIDHVVIGPTGVFAIETKGRPKPIKKNGSSEHAVNYDGKSLSFPTWVERKPIQQAESQAKWLEKWLSSAVGEPVKVNPILVIPGWFIKRNQSGGIPVINGKNPSALFAKRENCELSDKLQRQIVHQIDTRCRTILPKAYQKP